MGKSWRCLTKKSIMIAVMAAALLVPNLPAMAKSVNPAFILMALDPMGLKTEAEDKESEAEAYASETEAPVAEAPVLETELFITETPVVETEASVTDAPSAETEGPGTDLPEAGMEELQTELTDLDSPDSSEPDDETEGLQETQTDEDETELTDSPDDESGEDVIEEVLEDDPSVSEEKEAESAEKESAASGNDPVIAPVLDETEIIATLSGFSIDVSSYPPADTSANTKYIYKYLTDEMGLNHAAACGVLANMQLESGFNQYAIGDGGTSFGICQWHNERFSSLMLYCGSTGHDYNTLDGQLAFLSYELSGRYPNVLNYLRAVPNTPDGAYSAGYYWCVYYEAPSETQARAAQRGNLARYEYYPLDLSSEEAAEGTSEEPGEETSDESVFEESPAEVIRQLREIMADEASEETEDEVQSARQAVADVREMMEAEND